MTLRLRNGSIDELNPKAYNATIAAVLYWGSMWKNEFLNGWMDGQIENKCLSHEKKQLWKNNLRFECLKYLRMLCCHR